MTAAVYARKSTSQAEVADEAKSVRRQVEGAKAFIAAKGWTLDEHHVYTVRIAARSVGGEGATGPGGHPGGPAWLAGGVRSPAGGAAAARCSAIAERLRLRGSTTGESA